MSIFLGILLIIVALCALGIWTMILNMAVEVASRKKWWSFIVLCLLGMLAIGFFALGLSYGISLIVRT